MTGELLIDPALAGFDPMTEDQANAALAEVAGDNEQIGRALRGLYNVKRAGGSTIEEALEASLTELIAATGGDS